MHLFLVGLIFALFMSLVYEVFRVHCTIPWLPHPHFFFSGQGFNTDHTHHVISNPKMKMCWAYQKICFLPFWTRERNAWTLNSWLLPRSLRGISSQVQWRLSKTWWLRGTDNSHLNTLGRSISKRLTTLNSVNVCGIAIERRWKGTVFLPKNLDVSQRKKYLP